MCVSFSDRSKQIVKDYCVVAEYKNLKDHGPLGIYVNNFYFILIEINREVKILPSFDNLRVWHGVLFVRSGLFKNGVFRFRVDIPEEYAVIFLAARPLINF